MKLKILPVALAIVGTAIALTSARAQQEIFFANLSGPAESPPNNSTATGFATVTLDLALMTMRVQVDFAGLSSNTTAAHIHAPTTMAFEGTAGVATVVPAFPGFPLGVTSGTSDSTLDLTQASSFNPAFVTANGGSVSASAAVLISAIEQGKAYLNIHTVNFGGGEIRGFLAVPEPTTLSLVAVGGAAIFVAAQRRKRHS